MPSTIRFDNWWNAKVPPMLSFAYFAMLSGTALPSTSRILVNVAVFLVSVFGIAGFGHVFTDIFDVAEDRIRGQRNSWDLASPSGKTALVGGLLAASIVPWLFLPRNATVYLLLAAEFLAFVAYAVPPLRFKTRGLPGIAADRMYAHTLPALWTWVPFAILSDAPAPLWAGMQIAAWAFPLGARELMLHQAIDADIDRAAGVRTYGAVQGRHHLMKTIGTRLFPVEVIMFSILLGLAAVRAPVAAAGFFVYIAYSVAKVKGFWLNPVNRRSVFNDAVTIECRRIMSPFYYGWLPLLLLVNLAVRDVRFVLLLALHFLLFRGMIVPLIRTEITDARAFVRYLRARAKLTAKAAT